MDFNFILLQGCQFVVTRLLQPCHHHACSKQSSYNLVTAIIYFVTTLSPPCSFCKQPCLSFVTILLQACTTLSFLYGYALYVYLTVHEVCASIQTTDSHHGILIQSQYYISDPSARAY